MTKRILYIAIACGLAALAWYGWKARSGDLAMADGSVTSRDSPSTPAPDSGAVNLDGRAMPDGPAPPVSPAQTDTAIPRPAPTVSSAGTSPSTSTTATFQPAGATVPASAPTTDTLSPNAPNGMAFGGSGKFQWYRQGNLTWRINTQSGSSCIAFATMEEWQKPIVYQHGCGNA